MRAPLPYSEFIEYRSADRSCSIHIHASVLDLLAVEAGRLYAGGGDERVGGLLIGSAAPGGARPALTVESLHSMFPLELATIRSSLEFGRHVKACGSGRDGGTRAAGYYRTDAHAGTDLTEADAALLGEHFTVPAVVLLVGAPATEGAPVRAFVFTGAAGAIEAKRIELPPWQHLWPAAPGEAEAMEAPAEPPRAPKWLGRLRIGALLAVAALAGGAVVYRSLGNAGTSPGARALREAEVLGLRLERVGPDFRLSWDRGAVAVVNAQGAILSIWDRDQRKDYRMDPSQLRAGMLLYSPRSNDVNFQLELFGEAGPVSESVRAIGGAEGPPVSAGAGAMLQWVQGQVESRTPAAPRRSGLMPPLETPRAFRPPPARAPVRLGPFTLAPPPEPSVPASANPFAVALPPPPAPAPAEPVRTGEPAAAATPAVELAGSTALTAATEDYSPAVARQQPLPEIPPELRAQLQGEAEVTIALRIDAAGRVTSAIPAGVTNTVRWPFIQASLNAARKWVFAPATLQGKRVASEFVVTFRFTR